MATYMTRYIEYKDNDGKWHLLRWYNSARQYYDSRVIVRSAEDDTMIDGVNYKVWLMSYNYNPNHKRKIYISSDYMFYGVDVNGTVTYSFDEHNNLKKNDDIILVGWVDGSENLKIINHAYDINVPELGEINIHSDYCDNAMNIREFIRNSFDGCSFAERGYPNDMAEETKAEIQKSIDYNNGTDYTYAHTHYTLAELCEFASKKEEEYLNLMFDAIRKEEKKGISEKLDMILNAVLNKNVEEKEEDDEENNEDDYYDSVEYYKEEYLPVIHSLYAEIAWASHLAEEICGIYIEENIRFIVNLN